jgi:hypothetical protein
MAFDQATRNKLQKFVSDARGLLTEEFSRQMQNDYGMDPDTGLVSPIGSLPNLTDAQHQTAILLRETMAHYQAAGSGNDAREILGRIVREQAFTVLNRLCALRMAEARDILMESITKAYNSKGFQLYARVAGTALGEIGNTYRNYLFSVFDEFSNDLAVLFDRYSPMGRLFPKETALLALLGKINDMEIDALWAEDETIGWIYQYFNSKEERKKMRDESDAPRNSRELAVRNQFFTPRYVVEFLTDNTLGRIWYEMTKGDTGLKDQCRYLVRRPNEIFLKKGEKAPEQKDNDADLSQEELLAQPVYIEHRPMKDPREILMLDPACGSMHFGLYAFDLFEKIYEEAWDLQSSAQWQGADNRKKGLLTEIYKTKDELLRDIPRLIIENNIHGIDIDPRAVQIAGLSLWLRAQRSWKEQNVKSANRPQIRKSNIVCAEPMPGEKEFLKAFSESLKPKVLGQLLEIIFEKMELAGEAGSLLKIEEEIADAVEQAREEFNKELLRRKDEAGCLPGFAPKVRQRELFDFADLPDKTQFWQTAEEKILEALKNYAEQAEAEDGTRLRLFAEDAAKGFAFIDLCRKRYDAIVMNPPFGAFVKSVKKLAAKVYEHTWQDIYASFIERGLELLSDKGRNGAITSGTYFNLASLEKFRTLILGYQPTIFINLGTGVMDDAAVSAAASVIVKSIPELDDFVSYLPFLDVRDTENRPEEIANAIEKSMIHKRVHNLPPSVIRSLPKQIFAYWLSKSLRTVLVNSPRLGQKTHCAFGLHCHGNDEKLFRAWWEVNQASNFLTIWPVVKLGGNPEHFYRDSPYVVNWISDGAAIKQIASEAKGGTLVGGEHYFKKGLSYIYTGATFSVQPLEKGSIFSAAAHGCFPPEVGAFLSCLAYLNSEPIRLLAKVINPNRFFQSAYVRLLPIPQGIYSSGDLREMAAEAVKISREHCRGDECSRIFTIEWVSESISSRQPEEVNFCFPARHLAIRRIEKIAHIKSQIDHQSNLALGLTTNDIRLLQTWIPRTTAKPLPGDQYIWLDKSSTLTEAHLSYVFGTIFGRWDIRYVTGELQPPELPDPFEQLPICPPGMLQNSHDLPAEPNDVPADYPLRISWPGIIVDDEGHTEDIISHIREAIEVIWKDKANDIEQEASEILGMRSLREYFAKPAKFFADHLKRYSKSRRQAPIYWPLSIPSGSYTLWLYYHRLTDQSLYICVNNFVGPKLKDVTEDADNLRKKSNRSSQEEKELEKLSDLALELRDFHDELLRIAAFWKPNLNDGVQITAAPLWKLFQHKPWQKTLKQTWKDLETGKYDWAHLAYSIWPERVIRASHKDRSYAIAHNLEDDLWEEVETGTDRQGNPKTKWVPKDFSEKEFKQFIAQMTEGKR